jgi:hypothetical protein
MIEMAIERTLATGFWGFIRHAATIFRSLRSAP